MRALVPFALLFCVACPPAPKQAELPPPGLAGAPGSAGGGFTLPGVGHAVPEPTGTASPGTGLPPGHPPIPGNDGMPAGHPPIDGAAPAPASADPQLTGKVLETMDVPEYTYMKLKTSTGEEWVAVGKTKVDVGDTVTVSQSLVMEDFASRQLNRTFPRLVMGVMIGVKK